MPSTYDNLTKTAFPMLDMMINMQRMGLQAMSAYQPLASAVLSSASAAERGTRASLFETQTARSTERHDLQERPRGFAALSCRTLFIRTSLCTPRP